MSKKKKKQWVVLESAYPEDDGEYFSPLMVEYKNIETATIHVEPRSSGVYEYGFIKRVKPCYNNGGIQETYFVESKTSFFDVLKQLESQKFDFKMNELLNE